MRLILGPVDRFSSGMTEDCRLASWAQLSFARAIGENTLHSGQFCEGNAATYTYSPELAHRGVVRTLPRVPNTPRAARASRWEN
jgi:hypothetical protein